jgi:hypothetical protein
MGRRNSRRSLRSKVAASSILFGSVDSDKLLNEAR